MSSFKKFRTEKIATENNDDKRKITNVNTGDGFLVNEFEFAGMQKSSELESHPLIKENARRNDGFKMSSLLRQSLGLDQEENEKFEARVVDELAKREVELRKILTEEAHKNGYLVGQEEGRLQVLQEGQSKITRLNEIIKGFDEAKSTIFSANEDFIVKLSSKIAKRILLRELKTDQDYMLRLSRELIERLGVKENIKIRVSSNDFSLMIEMRPELDKHFGTLRNVSIEASSSINDGGCEIETDFMTIESNINSQIDFIEKEIFKDGES